jgi:hypothetical protein
MENKDQPINPIVKPGFVYSDGSHEEPIVVANGLTKREYYAGLAMQGMLANPLIDKMTRRDKNRIVEVAIEHADELLNQLNQPQP